MESLPRTLEIYDWHTPATDYQEQELNGFRIHRSRQWYGYYNYWGMDGYLFWRVRKPIPVIQLQEKRGKRWRTWMIDDPPQQRAMEIYAAGARGRVLVAGLGLGLILHELARNARVKSIVVVEKSLEVMGLVIPNIKHLFEPKEGRPLMLVTNEDFYDFIEDDNQQWDTIIVDLWVSHGKEEKMGIFYHEVLPLHARLIQKYYDSEITYHGFQSISATKPVSDEMAKLVMKGGE